jgi:hypothetical protein
MMMLRANEQIYSTAPDFFWLDEKQAGSDRLDAF